MNSFRTEHYEFKDFRELTESEILSVWEIRNHSEIRKYMTHPEPIELADHLLFVKSLSEREDVKYYLVKDEGGNIIGSVNISHITLDTVERGIYISPDCQGKRHAKRLTMEFYDYIHRKFSINTIITKVVKGNKPSNALENSLGAEPSAGELAGYNYYMLKL